MSENPGDVVRRPSSVRTRYASRSEIFPFSSELPMSLRAVSGNGAVRGPTVDGSRPAVGKEFLTIQTYRVNGLFFCRVRVVALVNFPDPFLLLLCAIFRSLVAGPCD